MSEPEPMHSTLTRQALIASIAQLLIDSSRGYDVKNYKTATFLRDVDAAITVHELAIISDTLDRSARRASWEASDE